MADGERVRYGSIQVLGLALVSAALVTVLVVIAVLGQTEELGFFGMVTALSVVVTVVVSRVNKTWARALGLVGAVVVVGTVFFLGFGIFQIFSPVEFIIGLLIVFGFLLAVFGGVMALVAGIRGRRDPARVERPLRNVVLGTIAVASVISVVGFFATRERVEASEVGDATAVEMVNFEFAPESISTPGRVVVHNSDPFAHDFTIE
ncbi:MAG: hypothetical protein R3246_11570, partial [Acidimicrobiia bacterium]|nr:hypothetical protein [Acidimicrobiia bacterium]